LQALIPGLLLQGLGDGVDQFVQLITAMDPGKRMGADFRIRVCFHQLQEHGRIIQLIDRRYAKLGLAVLPLGFGK